MNIIKAINLFIKVAQDADLENNRELFVQIIRDINNKLNNISDKISNLKYCASDTFNYARAHNKYFDNLVTERNSFGDRIVPTDPIPLTRYIKKIFSEICVSSRLNDLLKDWFLTLFCAEAKNIFKTDKLEYPFFEKEENRNKLKEVFKNATDHFYTQVTNVRNFLIKMQNDSGYYETVPSEAKGYDYVEYNKVSGGGEEKAKNKKNREKTTLGRFIRRQLEVSQKDVPDHVVAAIVKEYSNCVSELKDFDKDVKQIEGESIVETYSTFDVKVHSCMTGYNSRKVKLYALNPDKVKLVHYKDVARALLWTCDDGTLVLDRVYPSGSKYVSLIRNWAKKNNIVLRSNPDSAEYNDIMLSDGSVRHVTMIHNGIFPYMDTFTYGKVKSGDINNDGVIVFSNYKEDNDYKFQDTEGYFIELDPKFTCYECGILVREQDIHVAIHHRYCGNCFYERFFVCQNCLGVGPKGQEIEFNEEKYCRRCFDYYFSECNKCKKVFSKESLLRTYSYNRDVYEYYCPEDSVEHIERCPSCYNTVLKDEMKKVEELELLREKTPKLVCPPCYNNLQECETCKAHVDYNLINNTCENCNSSLYDEINMRIIERA